MTCPSTVMDFSALRGPSGRPCLPTRHRRFRLPFDQLREHPGAVPEEIRGLLERLTEVPDLAIRGVRLFVSTFLGSSARTGSGLTT
jgi:hypothetical protein